MRTSLLLAVLAIAACSKAVDDYKRRSMATEGALRLNNLVKDAKVALVRDATYPVATTELTPATPCCSFPDHKCPADPAVWDAEPWKTLEFSIYEPSRYRMSYASDGKTFTARAVADLDCDEQEDPGDVVSAIGSVDTENMPVVVFSDDKRRK